MGSCNSSLEDDAAAKAASKSIDAQLKLEENEIKRTAKLLLLGAGETGKSTVLKQMRMIYNIPFNEIELSMYRTGMVLNLVTCAKTLAQSMEKLQIPYGFHKPEESVDEGDELSASPGLSHGKTLRRESTPLAKQEVVEGVVGSAAAKVTSRPQDPYARYARELYLAQKEANHQSCCSFNAAKYIQECDISFCFGGGNTVPEELVNAIKIFWEDSGVHVMSDPVRICSAEYKPTEEDILRVRIMTVKINEVKFSAQGTTFQVVDVGGQRSERKKWIPYFEDARAIIYMVALNSYDQTCFEDSVTNRITESLTLFNTIAHHPILKDTSIILFLNKIDLFKAKLLEVPVASYFPDYTGSNDIESASKYFDDRFRHENTYTKRAIFTHLTWATDKEQISNIIGSVLVSLTKAVLEDLGMM
ncbi:Guanine nucleotide-binding protein alpha-2 subunit [Chytriomyces hyalinus]|nr:Guanine nucleotide-binding protein alpha-2 subunit [Chytriomyces hyalinus]